MRKTNERQTDSGWRRRSHVTMGSESGSRRQATVERSRPGKKAEKGLDGKMFGIEARGHIGDLSVKPLRNRESGMGNRVWESGKNARGTSLHTLLSNCNASSAIGAVAKRYGAITWLHGTDSWLSDSGGREEDTFPLRRGPRYMPGRSNRKREIASSIFLSQGRVTAKKHFTYTHTHIHTHTYTLHTHIHTHTYTYTHNTHTTHTTHTQHTHTQRTQRTHPPHNTHPFNVRSFEFRKVSCVKTS